MLHLLWASAGLQDKVAWLNVGGRKVKVPTNIHAQHSKACPATATHIGLANKWMADCNDSDHLRSAFMTIGTGLRHSAIDLFS